MQLVGNSGTSAAICVLGWHFNRDFYEKLAQVEHADIWVISHRALGEVPEWLKAGPIATHLLIEPNVGYDWGGYQQFLNKVDWRSYNHLFFMHDDLIVKKPGFVEAAIDLLEDGFPIVGNGRNSSKRDWPLTHLQCYAHSSWIPPSEQYQHDTVRGSFFGAKVALIRSVTSFEIFWDRWRINMSYGNHSMIATCGKIADLGDRDQFGFLSDNYLESDYLLEEVRGGTGRRSFTRYQRVINTVYNRIAWHLVSQQMHSLEKPAANEIRQMVLKRVLGMINGGANLS